MWGGRCACYCSEPGLLLKPWGATKRLFYYLTFFFFRRREQKHWNSAERQKEIQPAEKLVSSQSNILTYDLGGAECWTWRSLCNYCRLHWYSYNVTNCKSSGKGKQPASIVFIHGNYTNNVLSHQPAIMDVVVLDSSQVATSMQNIKYRRGFNTKTNVFVNWKWIRWIASLAKKPEQHLQSSLR